ncbi:hypothetical protein PAMA_005979 [Pampus argenteus]
MTKPLLKDIEESDYKQLQSESSEKITTLAKEIAKSMEEDEDIEHLGEQSSQKPTVPLEKVSKKIRTFFAKYHAKISLHRMITQLWWQKTQAAKHSRRLTQALQEAQSTSHVGLLSPDTEAQNGIVHCLFKIEEEEEDRVKMEMENIKLLVEMLVFEVYSKAKVKLTTMQINNIVKRLFERIWAEFKGKKLRLTSEMLEPFNKAMFNFLVKNWWSAANILVMMMLEEPVIDDYIASCFSVCLLIQPDTWSTTEEDIKRMHIMFLVQKFVTRVYNKAKVQWTMQAETIDIIKRLFNKIWAKVEGLELRITAETLMSLDKSVLKDLVKQWDASCLHIVMNLEEASIDDFIVSSFYSRLMGPAKKRSIISKWFISVGFALLTPFRWTHAPLRGCVR